MNDNEFNKLVTGLEIEFEQAIDTTPLTSAQLDELIAETEQELSLRGELREVQTETARRLHARRGALLLERSSRNA